MVWVNCHICGTPVQAIRKQKRLCEECRQAMHGVTKQKKQDFRQTKKPAVSIDRIATLAREAGMSYGKYVATHWQEVKNTVG